MNRSDIQISSTAAAPADNYRSATSQISGTLQMDRCIKASVQLASGQTSCQLPITDTGCGIINNDITPCAS